MEKYPLNSGEKQDWSDDGVEMLAIAAILGFAADLWPRNSASDAVIVTLVCIGIMATIRIILDCTPGRRRLRYERALHLQEVWRSQWEKEYQAQNK